MLSEIFSIKEPQNHSNLQQSASKFQTRADDYLINKSWRNWLLIYLMMDTLGMRVWGEREGILKSYWQMPFGSFAIYVIPTSERRS